MCMDVYELVYYRSIEALGPITPSPPTPPPVLSGKKVAWMSEYTNRSTFRVKNRSIEAILEHFGALQENHTKIVY